MSEFKKTLKKIGRQIWELFKGSLPGALMYACAGAVLVILTMRGEASELSWTGGKITWVVICIVVASAYAGIMSYINGGSGYDMLVTGNVKRMSETERDGGYKISKHVFAKEYRAWKGFAIGGFMIVWTLLAGLIFGAKQAEIDAMLADVVAGKNETSTMGKGLGVIVILSLFISGWSLLPIFITNASIVTTGGVGISYYWSCLFCLLPIAIVGTMYIVGAYGKRAKTMRKQAIADAEAEAEANREKKINYGGLPGTKPKKRK